MSSHAALTSENCYYSRSNKLQMFMTCNNMNKVKMWALCKNYLFQNHNTKHVLRK